MKYLDVPAVVWRLDVEPLLTRADVHLADAIARMPTSLERVQASRALSELRKARRQLDGNLARAEHGERLR